MEKMTKGQLEAKISEAIIKFEMEYMGRGPMETKTYILDDLLFVRLKGFLTQAEKTLAKTVEGAELIKKTRVKLLGSERPVLKKIISDTTNCQIRSLHSDISTKTGEKVIVFVLDKNIENKFRH
jgi:uncharacterized protein YbcI